jgi:hypothetical protein
MQLLFPQSPEQACQPCQTHFNEMGHVATTRDPNAHPDD